MLRYCGAGVEDDNSDADNDAHVLVSEAYPYPAWRDALPPLCEVCGCVGGEQGRGCICYSPHTVNLKPHWTNGKDIMRQ